MTTPEPYQQMLTGGHHNSLGRTEEVVKLVLADADNLPELYNCYFSDDEVVRLRTSSAFKRVAQAQPAWLVPYIDRFLNEISQIDQASTQWTLAILFETLESLMTPAQKKGALAIMKRNVAEHHDWIVLNYTMQVLADWAADDPDLKHWLWPHLERLAGDSRKAVAKRANKLLGN